MMPRLTERIHAVKKEDRPGWREAAAAVGDNIRVLQDTLSPSPVKASMFPDVSFDPIAVNTQIIHNEIARLMQQLEHQIKQLNVNNQLFAEAITNSGLLGIVPTVQEVTIWQVLEAHSTLARIQPTATPEYITPIE